MSISFIIVLWIIITIAQAVNDRKKKPSPPVPPPQNSTGTDFEIPTLANDPNQPDEAEEFENVDDWDDFENAEEVDIEEIYQQKKAAVQNVSAAKIQSEIETAEENKLAIDLTPAAVMNSIIMNEILDKPKSLRRRKF